MYIFAQQAYGGKGFKNTTACLYTTIEEPLRLLLKKYEEWIAPRVADNIPSYDFLHWIDTCHCRWGIWEVDPDTDQPIKKIHPKTVVKIALDKGY